MSSRVRFLTILVCALLFAAASNADNIFTVPPAGVSATTQVFSGSPPAEVGRFDSSPGSTLRILSTPTGTRYFSIDSAANEAVTTTDDTFNVLRRTGQWNEAATSGVMTPDGKYLLVLSGVLRVTDPLTGAEVANIPVGTNPVDVAVSIDSKYALVISSVSRKLYRVDLTTLAVDGTMEVTGQLTGISAAPNCLFYLSATNKVVVIDAQKFEEVGRIGVNGVPEKLFFAPSSEYGVATNRTPLTNASAWIFDLIGNRMQARIDALFLGGLTPILMDPRVQVVSDDRFLMTADVAKVIYEISIPNGELKLLSVGGTVTPDKVTAIVKSGEYPNAKYLYFTEGQALKRVDLSTDSLSGNQTTTLNTTESLFFAGPSSAGPAVDSILYNNNQTINEEDGEFKPLIVRALDANEKPIFGADVVFSTIDGVTITSAMTKTNQQGLAKAMVDPGDITGAIPVDVSVGGSPLTRFELAVGGGTGPGTGGLAVYSGQGQLVSDGFGNFFVEPLEVRVTQANLEPLPGATVTWAVTAGFGAIDSAITNTDADGMASVEFFPPQVDPGRSFSQTIVTATWNETSVDFYVTTYPSQVPGGGLAPAPEVFMITPPVNKRDLVGQAGTVLEGVIQVRVTTITGDIFGAGIPNVSLRAITPTGPEAGPWAQCEDGLSGETLTDAEGLASCNLRVGGQVGIAPMQVKVGGQFLFFPGFSIEVLPGAPASVVPVQGDNQTGFPGEALPLDLVAEVRDGLGTPLAGIVTTWDVTPAGGATLSNVSGASDGLGRTSAKVTLGDNAGPVTVTVSAGTASYSFKLTILSNATQFNKVSGDNQTAEVGTQFAGQLVVQLLDADSNGVEGQQVDFEIVSGSGSLSWPTATTNAQGIASVNVTAGDTPGALQVRGSVAGLPAVLFNLTVRAPGPGITPDSFRNGAGGQPGVVPGGVVNIYAPGIAPGLQNCVMADSPGGLPLELAGLTVQFGSDSAPLWAPIYYVCNINGVESAAVQAPWALTPGTTSATVRVSGGSTTVQNVPVFAVQPGVFETTGPLGRYGVVMRPNGSFVSPINPARRGETLCLFATGLGAITPPSTTGAAGIPGQEVAANLVIGVNNAGVRVIRGEYAINMIGVYAVYFEMPMDTATGPRRPFALAVRVSDTQLIFGNGSVIAVQ